jgi:hypothetical protein
MSCTRLALLFLTLATPLVDSLILDMLPGQQRCLQEVLSRHDLVKGSFKLLEPVASGERSGFTIKVRLWHQGS